MLKQRSQYLQIIEANDNDILNREQIDKDIVDSKDELCEL